MAETIDIVFTAPPRPDRECVFVEVERDGRSVSIGEWVDRRDGTCALRIPTADVPHALLPVVGALIITWPKAGPAGLNPTQVKLTDAETGEQIVTVTKMVIDADCNAHGLIMADLTMLCDADGNPLRSSQALLFDENGKLRTAVFRWVVAEMRVAS